ncbi:Hypothetical predicted protein [Paramuricea clavata]|uniref:DUF5641 domain-containing protein n=1 Tax=Paramuricea clavata TaxID=317549 RepID=A0A7D9DIF6_PARCT|nr:Hypothetical predicted protein [Paramuricea clavata]
MATAKEGSQEFGENARDFLEQEFHVDDGLKSFANPEEPITTVKNAQATCASANLRLHKFVSNNKVVLEAISNGDRANDLKDLDLRHDALPIQLELDPNDQDVRKEVTTVLTTQQVRRDFPKVLEADRFKHSSSFYRLKRSIVCMQRMIERKRSDKQYNWRIQEGPPTVRELEEAEKSILKSIQYKHFSAEVDDMQRLAGNEYISQDRQSAKVRNSALKRTSSLHKLDPFLDGEGILRVGGRLKNATTPYEVKYPVLIPKNDYVTNLLIRHRHVAQKHQGYGITHNGIRQAGYWVINGRTVISHAIHGCVTCRRLQGNHGTQLDDESLRTLMTEAESVVNNRPLTVCNLLESGTHINNWPLGKVVEVYPSDDDLVRKVRILVSHGGKLSHLDRPVHKLVLIVAQEDGEKENI